MVWLGLVTAVLLELGFWWYGCDFGIAVAAVALICCEWCCGFVGCVISGIDSLLFVFVVVLVWVFLC